MVADFDSLAEAYDTLLHTPLWRVTSEDKNDDRTRAERWEALVESTEVFQAWLKEKMPLDFDTMDRTIAALMAGDTADRTRRTFDTLLESMQRRASHTGRPVIGMALPDLRAELIEFRAEYEAMVNKACIELIARLQGGPKADVPLRKLHARVLVCAQKEYEALLRCCVTAKQRLLHAAQNVDEARGILAASSPRIASAVVSGPLNFPWLRPDLRRDFARDFKEEAERYDDTPLRLKIEGYTTRKIIRVQKRKRHAKSEATWLLEQYTAVLRDGAAIPQTELSRSEALSVWYTALYRRGIEKQAAALAKELRAQLIDSRDKQAAYTTDKIAHACNRYQDAAVFLAFKEHMDAIRDGRFDFRDLTILRVFAVNQKIVLYRRMYKHA